MAKLNLSIAIGDYDRVRPRALSTALSPIDGVSPVFLTLEPEEIFFRAFRHTAFDIAVQLVEALPPEIGAGRQPLCRLSVFPSLPSPHICS